MSDDDTDPTAPTPQPAPVSISRWSTVAGAIRANAVAAVSISLAAFAACWMFLYTQYETWDPVTEPPPVLHVEHTRLSLGATAPTETLPGTVSWAPSHHLWPLGYDIYWPVGYDDTTSVFLHWRNGLFYQYVTRG